MPLSAAHVRHRVERPSSFLPRTGPFDGGGRAGPGGRRHVHVLVFDPRTSLDDGRDVGGDSVTHPRTMNGLGITGALWLVAAAFAIAMTLIFRTDSRRTSSAWCGSF